MTPRNYPNEMAWAGFLMLSGFIGAVLSECPENEVIIVAAPYTWEEMQSPGFPNNYDANLDVCWRIEGVNDDDHIQLEVTDTAIEVSVGCQNADYVEIRDGPNHTSSLMTRFCGGERPSVLSTGPNLFVRFHTNADVSDTGFHFRYRSVSNSNISSDDTTTPAAIRTQDGDCHDTRYLDAGYYDRELQSPGYPIAYTGGQALCWVISAHSAHEYVELVIMDSQMEYNLFCTDGDYVEVREGGSTWGYQLRLWCGSSEPSLVRSETRSLLVRFRADDDDNSYRGFKLLYKAIRYYDSYNGYLNDTMRTYVGIGVFFLLFVVIVSALTIRRKYFLKGRIVSSQSSAARCEAAPPICRQRPARRRLSSVILQTNRTGPYSIAEPPGYQTAVSDPAYPPSYGSNDVMYPSEPSGGVFPPPEPSKPPPYTSPPEEPPPPYMQNFPEKQ